MSAYIQLISRWRRFRPTPASVAAHRVVTRWGYPRELLAGFGPPSDTSRWIVGPSRADALTVDGRWAHVGETLDLRWDGVATGLAVGCHRDIESTHRLGRYQRVAVAVCTVSLCARLCAYAGFLPVALHL